MVDYPLRVARHHPYYLIDLVEMSKYCIPAKLPENYGYLRFNGDCNGLVCLSDSRPKETIRICNPITGEYVTLPRLTTKRRNIIEWYGFGFCPSTNHYKYLRGVAKIRESEARIYTTGLKSNIKILTVGVDSNWRFLKDDGCPYYLESRGLSYNGAIHWKILFDGFPHCTAIHYKLTRVFDVTEEKFRSIPTPRDFKNSGTWDLAVLQGRLSIIDPRSICWAFQQLNIWIMKEYGVVESWSKEYIISVNRIRNDFHGPYPCTAWRDGQILVSTGDSLVSYHPTKDKREDFVVHRGVVYYPVKALFSPSFASLKDTLGIGGESMMVQYVKPR